MTSYIEYVFFFFFRIGDVFKCLHQMVLVLISGKRQVGGRAALVFRFAHFCLKFLQGMLYILDH